MNICYRNNMRYQVNVDKTRPQSNRAEPHIIQVLTDRQKALRFIVLSGAPACDIAKLYHITRARVYQLRKFLSMKGRL